MTEDGVPLPRDGQAPERVGDGRPHWHSEVTACQTSYDIFRILRRFSERHGFSRFIAIAEPGETGSRLSQVTMITNWAPEMLRGLDELSILDQGPALRWIRQSVEPLIWAVDTVFERIPDALAEPAKQLFKEFDVRNGVLFPIFAADGTRGAVDYSGGAPVPLDDSDIMEMGWISKLVFNQLKVIEEAFNPSRITLTEREIECITWIAAGKSSLEAAEIIGISPHTVDHYLTTAGRKLNTVNRAHTVATAMRLRLVR